MSRIKGRYVAQLVIDIDMQMDGVSADIMISTYREALKKELPVELQNALEPNGKVELLEQLFDLYEVKEDGED